MDWNGDGRRDVLVSQANGYLGVLLSTGTGLASTVISTSYPTASIAYTAAPNLTGDGQDGLIAWTGTSATYYLHNDPGAPPDLLTSVADGYGNSVSPTYVSLSQNNYTESSGGDATYPYADYIGPMYVVNEALFSDPSSTGGTYNQTFWYYGAYVNLQGRGFQSFYAKRMIDSRNGLYYFQYYERQFPESGMDFEDDLASSSGAQIAYSIRTPVVTTLSSATNEQRYFPYFNNVTSNQYELSGSEDGDLVTTTSTNYTYDNYGNATNIVSTVTDEDPGSPYNGNTWTTNVTNTTDISINQSADLAAWCLTMLDETQVVYTSTAAGSTSVTRTKVLTPDTPASCRIKTIVTEPTANSGLFKVTEALTFDSFGNVWTDTVTGANMPYSPASRLTTLNWGTTGQYLDSSTDPSGAITTWVYSSAQSLAFGVPDSVKDALVQFRVFSGS